MNYRMIITDLDDTFLNSDLGIGENDKKTLKKLDEAGIPLVLCSGRSSASVLKIAKAIFPDFKGRYMIGFNGAEIIDLEKNEIIYHQYLDKEIASQIADVAEREKMTVQVYQGDFFFVPKETPEAHYYEKMCDIPFKAVGPLRKFMNFDPPKLLIHAPHERLEAIYSEIEAITNGKASLTYSKPFYLESFNLNISKGAAVAWLANHLNIPIEQTIAMGDSPNDKEMLQTAGLSIAVANAQPAIQNLAKVVLHATHNENPLTEVVNRFVL